MSRVAWIKTDSFLFVVSFSARSRSRSRKRNERRSTEREREKEREEEKEESGGGMQRGKWCSKKLASTFKWNLKIPGSIPGSTLREIIHPKTTTKHPKIVFDNTQRKFLILSWNPLNFDNPIIVLRKTYKANTSNQSTHSIVSQLKRLLKVNLNLLREQKQYKEKSFYFRLNNNRPRNKSMDDSNNISSNTNTWK